MFAVDYCGGYTRFDSRVAIAIECRDISFDTDFRIHTIGAVGNVRVSGISSKGISGFLGGYIKSTGADD